MEPQYQFAIEIRGPDNQPLGQTAIDPDWVPAAEAVRGAALASGSTARIIDDSIHITPKWSEKLGAPYVESISASAEAHSVSISTVYFRPLARSIEKKLIEAGKLKEGDDYSIHALAYQTDGRTNHDRANHRFTIQEDDDLPLLQDRALAGEFSSADDQLPVFIPQHVLDETRALGEAAGEIETGGILIGHLFRDPAQSILFVEITSQIHARHTNASKTSLTFTDDTWMAARAAITIRKRGELALGWWHSHPAKSFCGEACTLERRLKCALQQPFLSAEDLHLHRTVFPRPWQFALLVNVADSGTTLSAWCWQRGIIEPATIHVPNADQQQRTTTPRRHQPLINTAV